MCVLYICRYIDFGKGKEVSVNDDYLRKGRLVVGWAGHKRLLLPPLFSLFPVYLS